MSARRVDDEVESVPVMVTGLEPKATNDEQEALPEQETVVVAVVERSPPLPVYRTPCDSDESLRGALIVDDAVEKNPFRSPKVVVVET